ncbi:hypothetical protein JTE90_009453 [Oedothorax gibbosus]|uniref:Uncharacterized protein n=1 Tax=Oedothorax gibbosus TaxID=931172 RepID=A0AAV6VRX2_9ARAC|nr:hypothetical protein JTE90_009453 [Oedothorax gibbosus]
MITIMRPPIQVIVIHVPIVYIKPIIKTLYNTSKRKIDAYPELHYDNTDVYRGRRHYCSYCSYKTIRKVTIFPSMHPKSAFELTWKKSSMKFAIDLKEANLLEL